MTTLSEEVHEGRQTLRTDEYAMSIGEWVSLYENKEIEIHPEFQRFFRWTNSQKSRLIESILLGIPIPPIFVSQQESGVWDVVDGLQRLSTIYELVGALRGENGNKLPPLKLEKTKYIPSFEGLEWDALPDDVKLMLKRSKINVSILLRESDGLAKYELFQRLNTGGSSLTEQEVRNCVLLMNNRERFVWIKEISEIEHFINTISVSDRALDEQYNVELALRFIVLALADNTEIFPIGDIGEFLTEKMNTVVASETFNQKSFDSIFRETFEIIDQTVGENVFRRRDHNSGKYKGGFSLSAYEVIALGIAHNLHNGTLVDKSKIEPIVNELWENNNYQKNSGSGLRAANRLPALLPLGRQLFCK